jgi:hypothetical protein
VDERAVADALRRLEGLVGEWTLEASFGAGGPPGSAVFEWMLDGRFLVERAHVEQAPDSVAIVGVDDDSGYVQHYFDSRGVARVYAMTFADRLWTLRRDKPDFAPLGFAQRFTGELSADGRTITGRWESSQDGDEWEHDFDLIYRRAS